MSNDTRLTPAQQNLLLSYTAPSKELRNKFRRRVKVGSAPRHHLLALGLLEEVRTPNPLHATDPVGHGTAEWINTVATPAGVLVGSRLMQKLEVPS